MPHAASDPSASGEAGTALRPGPAPGYRNLVEAQSARPANRVTPCALVTRAQAQRILRTELLEPLEAPQGPTCIYRTSSGRNALTLVVQSSKIEHLRRQLHDIRRVRVGDKRGYCGTLGRPALHLQLSRGRVLSISASCDVARRFAASALSRLPR